MTDDDRFFVWVGRVFSVLALLFVFACAVGALLILAADYRDSETKPVFVLPPDSSGIKHKAGKS